MFLMFLIEVSFLIEVINNIAIVTNSKIVLARVAGFRVETPQISIRGVRIWLSKRK